MPGCREVDALSGRRR